MIDTSAFCGHWPFRRLPAAQPAELKERLRALGITQAWVAPLDAVFYWDPQEANEALHQVLSDDPFFLPVGVVNVTLPSWRQDAKRCLEELGCRAFKLFPNYHRFDVESTETVALCELARAANVPVCVQMRMQDERGHPPLVKVPGVGVKGVSALAQKAPRTRLLVCAPYRNELKELRAASNVWAELSHTEWELSLQTALNAFGHERLVFGSHAPLHYPAAAVAKLAVETADLVYEDGPGAVQAVRDRNARVLLG